MAVIRGIVFVTTPPDEAKVPNRQGASRTNQSPVFASIVPLRVSAIGVRTVLASTPLPHNTRQIERRRPSRLTPRAHRQVHRRFVFLLSLRTFSRYVGYVLSAGSLLRHTTPFLTRAKVANGNSLVFGNLAFRLDDLRCGLGQSGCRSEEGGNTTVTTSIC